MEGEEDGVEGSQRERAREEGREHIISSFFIERVQMTPRVLPFILAISHLVPAFPPFLFRKSFR